MQITDLSESKKQVKVNIDKDKVEKERNAIINQVRQEAHVDGFRKGKIPLEFLKQKFKDVIEGRLTQNLIYESTEQILKEQNWNYVGNPDIKDIVLSEEGYLEYEMVVDIIPKLDVKDYTNLKLQKNVYSISENEINEVLSNLRKRYAEFIPVTGREIKAGDIAVIDFEAFHNNNPIKGGASKGFTLCVGNKEFFPEVEDKLIGCNIGDDKEIFARFPDDYADKKLKGEEVLFKIKINDIREEKLPELNDALAEKLGKFKTIDELKANLQKELAETRERVSGLKLKKEARTQLASDNQFEPPEYLVEKKIEDMIREAEADMRYKGLSVNEAEDIPKMRELYKENAKVQVKASLILREIAAKENITVSPEEIEDEIKKIAQAVRKSVKEAKAVLEQKNLLPVIEEELKEEKALDLVIAKAKIEEVQTGEAKQ